MMIEIVLDGNDNNEFLHRPRPVLAIEDFAGTDYSSYRQKAQEIITMYSREPIIIIRNQSAQCSNNMLAVALFVEAHYVENNIECVVFKVADSHAAIEAYKPYVALTIGIKYIIRLMEENAKIIYKEIALLEYLGLQIERDYHDNKLIITLPGQGEPILMASTNTSEALSLIGAIKALALAHVDVSIKAEFQISDENPSFDHEEIINQVIKIVSPWIA
ncbi:MAG: hypothetical protein IJW72_04290 [Alphaproteobacteria bacterium]|nr:hypothetical protein [Alphaproteobacteria bacterium]